ncbi:MAG: type II toxin-antitoxin system YafQ family toxin [Bacteroides sp.]|nr:type II toxin-antitoxin system YafQ family toxin [Bacteroides sp.]MCM1085201.1 type II toxin-antitoxin system YafQ family toxin [Bacteroides sp.]
MKTLVQSTQYKKDLKRIRNNNRKAAALLSILQLLENEEPIPEVYKPHMLTGDYTGCMECHIESDFLLIWVDPDTDEIDLLRLGSHSELFGKGAKK